MKGVKINKVYVELEETEDGRKKIKLLKNGLHPIDVLAELISAQNEEFKALYNRELCDWGQYDEPGEPGERPHMVFVLYSRETGERIPVQRFILWDEKTDKPVPIPQKILNQPGKRTMDRRDTLQHVSNFLDFKRMEADAQAKGLRMRQQASWKILESAKSRMEG